jgi:hypothetical protein
MDKPRGQTGGKQSGIYGKILAAVIDAAKAEPACQVIIQMEETRQGQRAFRVVCPVEAGGGVPAARKEQDVEPGSVEEEVLEILRASSKPLKRETLARRCKRRSYGYNKKVITEMRKRGLIQSGPEGFSAE